LIFWANPEYSGPGSPALHVHCGPTDCPLISGPASDPLREAVTKVRK